MLQKKYALFGIVGSLCFAVGDWLLGWVDPTEIAGVSAFFVRAGHGADYSVGKIVVTLVFAMLGMCFLSPCFAHISDLSDDEKTKKTLKYTFGLCSTSFVVIHFAASANALVFSRADQISGRESAAALVNGFSEVVSPALSIAYVFLGAALLVLPIAILRGKTSLRKSAAAFTPFVPMAVFAIAEKILPLVPFTYGLYTFTINAGMIVWFIYLSINCGNKLSERSDRKE